MSDDELERYMREFALEWAVKSGSNTRTADDIVRDAAVFYNFLTQPSPNKEPPQ